MITKHLSKVKFIFKMSRALILEVQILIQTSSIAKTFLKGNTLPGVWSPLY